MKSNKGITLISLVIYLIVLTIIMTIILVITIYFQRNTNVLQENTNSSKYLTRFNMYLENDLKDVQNIKIEGSKLKITKMNEEIIYTYINSESDKGIYRNKVKICDDVKNATFNLEQNYEKKILTINISIGEVETITKQLQFTI